MGHLKYIETLWICTTGERPVGIVKGWDEIEERWKFYIGTGDGRDLDEDIRLIMELGRKFHTLEFISAFGSLEPPEENDYKSHP